MKLGIVGLPNVGKSTLFNSLTKAGAQAANFPFCTIDPNVGIVAVPDERHGYGVESRGGQFAGEGVIGLGIFYFRVAEIFREDVFPVLDLVSHDGAFHIGVIVVDLAMEDLLQAFSNLGR